MVTEALRARLAARAARKLAEAVHVAARGTTRWVYDAQTRTWAEHSTTPGTTNQQGDPA